MLCESRTVWRCRRPSPPEATAYFNRTASYGLLIGDSWAGRSQPEADQKAYREVWNGMEPFTKGYYINGDSEVIDKRVRATFVRTIHAWCG